MSSLPSVISARYIRDYLIETTFDDGVVKVIDFSQWLCGPMFEPLKDKRAFKKFFVDGWTISWPNGADIAPETLYEWVNDATKQKNHSQAVRVKRRR